MFQTYAFTKYWSNFLQSHSPTLTIPVGDEAILLYHVEISDGFLGHTLRNPPTSCRHRSPYRQYKILASMFLAVVGTAAALVGPLNYARVVAVILDPNPSASRLLRAVAILGVGYIVEPTTTYFYVRSMSRVVDRAAARLKARAFRALLSQEVAFFDLMGSAEVSACSISSSLRVSTFWLCVFQQRE